MYGTVIENNTLYATMTGGPTYSERIYQTNAFPLVAFRTGDLECRESILGVRCERDGKLVWEKMTTISTMDTVGKSVYAYNFARNIQNWGAWPSPPSVAVFDATEHAGSLRLDFIPRQSGSPYANLASTNSFSIGADWADYQYAFEITTNDSSCRLDFNWPRAKS